jgi:hypothetical protein
LRRGVERVVEKRRPRDGLMIVDEHLEGAATALIRV